MKILYIAQGYSIDYQDDCLFIGLKELLGCDVVDINTKNLLYKSLDPAQPPNYYGRGFTVTRVLENDNTDRTDIGNKIKNNYFDYVVYGSVARCLDHFDYVNSCYPKSRIIMVDGEDETWFKTKFHVEDYIYFKREKNSNDKTIPISFAIPTMKLKSPVIKEKQLASLIPGNMSTYIYKDEDTYYNDYNISNFAITSKKSGWDCLRHYEILASNCIPLFFNLKNCPEHTMINFPKQKLISILDKCMKPHEAYIEEAIQNAIIYKQPEVIDNLLNSYLNLDSIIKDEYLEFQSYLKSFTQKNLTTLALAKYFINKIQEYN